MGAFPTILFGSIVAGAEWIGKKADDPFEQLGIEDGDPVWEAKAHKKSLQ